MSSLFNPTKEEVVCGTEKDAFGHNIVVKEEEVNIAVTNGGNIFKIKKKEDKTIYFKEEDVKKEEPFEVKSEDFNVKEKQPHGVKKEDVTVKEEKTHFRIPKVEEDVLGVKEMEEAKDSTISSTDQDTEDQVTGTSRQVQGFICSKVLNSQERKQPSVKIQQCGKLGKLQRLKEQVRIHTGKKQQHCIQYGKSFVQTGLKKHEGILTGEKPYKCCHCGKTFIQAKGLKFHEWIHTGKKPFHCSQCQKCFARPESLKVHMRTHTGEKPYKCSECGKSFNHLVHLKKHENLHTSDISYHCFQCGKSVSQAGRLKLHERRHREKTYKCLKCEKYFSSLQERKLHENIHKIHKDITRQILPRSAGESTEKNDKPVLIYVPALICKPQ